MHQTTCSPNVSRLRRFSNVAGRLYAGDACSGQSSPISKQEFDPSHGRSRLEAQSPLGPCRNGRARASVVTNGHQRSRRTAGHRPSDTRSWDDAAGRFGLWSRRSRVAASGSRRAATRIRNDRGARSETVEDHDPRFSRRQPLTWRFPHALTVLNTTQFRAGRPVQISHGGSRGLLSAMRSLSTRQAFTWASLAGHAA